MSLVRGGLGKWLCPCGGGRRKRGNSTRVNKTNGLGSIKGAPGLQKMALTQAKQNKEFTHNHPHSTHSQSRQVGTLNAFSSLLQIHPTPSPIFPMSHPPMSWTTLHHHVVRPAQRQKRKTPIHFSGPTQNPRPCGLSVPVVPCHPFPQVPSIQVIRHHQKEETNTH